MTLKIFRKLKILAPQNPRPCLRKDIRRILPVNKKAQVWSLDAVVASIIFLFGIILLFFYAINYNSQTKISLDELFYEGGLASDLILSEDDFGILSNDKINLTKLNDTFGDSAKCDARKIEMGMTRDFYFNLGGNVYCTIPANTEDLVKISRVTIYNDKPTKFELFVYDE
ncbi:MAG: hypothetical protein ABIB79_05060 [archaeon]